MSDLSQIKFEMGSYSSVVGNSVHIIADDGRMIGQIAILCHTDDLRGKDTQTALCERIVAALEPAPITPAEARENVVDIIEEIICETHDLDVRDRDYAENVVAWLEKYHPAALRAIAGEGE